MLDNLILGVASLVHGSPLAFFEEPAALPAATVEIQTEHPFNAVTVFQPEGNDLPKISYQNPTDKKFKEWELADEPSEEGDITRPDLLEMIFFDGVQTKLILRSDEEANVVFHFYNTVIPGEDLTAQLSTSDQTMLDPENIPSEINFGSPQPPKFFSREDWGADESLRIATKEQKLFAKKWFSTEADVVPPKYKPVIKERQNTDGEYWFWPISESQNIAKFVVHHTGEAVKKISSPIPKGAHASDLFVSYDHTWMGGYWI
ncbi:hypothetical protein HC823_01645 [Candidatus Gracilibacteria bacterium]|nr:hypothetical protein [Candidatus Gracilibacteria bacterium]